MVFYAQTGDSYRLEKKFISEVRLPQQHNHGVKRIFLIFRCYQQWRKAIKYAKNGEHS